MDLKTFFEQFETIAEAPGGIQVLRNLILDMAVRGKLVPQDPEDESIAIDLQTVQKNEDIPKQWMCCELKEVVTLKSGMTLNKSKELDNGDIPYLKVGDMNLPGNEKIINTSSRFISRSSDIEKGIIPPNSIIFPKRGGAIATNKKRISFKEILVDSNVMSLVCDRPTLLNLDYLFTWFSTIDLALLNTGTSVPQVNNKDIGPLLISIPPIAEQKRIVAKVDELMELCDRLEAAQQNRNTLRQSLRASAFDALMNATTDDDLNTAWSFIHQNWPHLSQHPQDVEDIRRSVLQLAIRGKLVPQDTDDESASTLIEKIMYEKNRLIKQHSGQI